MNLDAGDPVLDAVVAAERYRAQMLARLRPDPARAAAGWARRFIADEARAAEAVALYRALGFEAVTDPLRPQDLSPGCEACVLTTPGRLQTVYTRRPTREDQSP